MMLPWHVEPKDNHSCNVVLNVTKQVISAEAFPHVLFYKAQFFLFVISSDALRIHLKTEAKKFVHFHLRPELLSRSLVLEIGLILLPHHYSVFWSRGLQTTTRVHDMTREAFSFGPQRLFVCKKCNYKQYPYYDYVNLGCVLGPPRLLFIRGSQAEKFGCLCSRVIRLVSMETKQVQLIGASKPGEDGRHWPPTFS